MAGQVTFTYNDSQGNPHTALAGSNASGNTATGVTLFDINGNAITILPVTMRTTLATWTDRSATITTGGTAQQAAAANASRTTYYFQNRSTASLYLNATGTASATVTAGNGSIEVAPGQLYEPPAGGVPGSAISVFGATTGQAYVFKEC